METRASFTFHISPALRGINNLKPELVSKGQSIIEELCEDERVNLVPRIDPHIVLNGNTFTMNATIPIQVDNLRNITNRLGIHNNLNDRSVTSAVIAEMREVIDPIIDEYNGYLGEEYTGSLSLVDLIQRVELTEFSFLRHTGGRRKYKTKKRKRVFRKTRFNL